MRLNLICLLVYGLIALEATLLAQTTPLPQPSPMSLTLPDPPEDCIRIATFNVSLHRRKAGELKRQLQGKPLKQIQRLQQIVRYVSPDVILLNEVDYDEEKLVAYRLMDIFNEPDKNNPSDAGKKLFNSLFVGPVNTGMPSGLDLNRDGKSDGPNDAWGFGQYPGQYGMVLLSRLPVGTEEVRTFQNFRWADMPDAKRPMMADGESYFDDETWSQLRLSSKSHWDVPILFNGRPLHVLASHPTPPVFDGPEDRNGCRNHDEIRLWSDYIAGGKSAEYLVDDDGNSGGLKSGAGFVILGDLNADPNDGDGIRTGIQALLQNPKVRQCDAPASVGATQASQTQAQKNTQHNGPAKNDTADFNDGGSGNLRCDFLIPSSQLQVVDSGVFWPTPKEIEAIDPGLLSASDHRLVWIDVKWTR